MSEGVEILLSADDQASAKMAAMTKNIENNVKNIKDTGSKAKASTEFFGQIANVTGNSQLGGYASQLAGLTEKIGQFSEVSKAGGVGALAFQGGLVAATAAISFGIGKALGDVIFETKRWTDELEAAKKKMGEIDQQMLTLQGKQLSQRREIVAASGEDNKEAVIKAEIAALDKKLSQEQDSLKHAKAQLETAKQIKKESWTETPAEMNGRLDTATQAVALAEEKLKVTNAEKVAYQDMIGVHAQELEAIKASGAAKLQWEQAVAAEAQKNIADRIKEAEQAEQEYQAGIKATEDARKSVVDERIREAEQANAQYEAEKESIENLIKAEKERNELRKITLEQGEGAAKQKQLEMQGVDKATAAKMVAEDKALTKLENARKAGEATTNTASESRLMSRGPSQDNGVALLKTNEEMLKELQEARKEAALARSKDKAESKGVKVELIK